MPAAAPPHPPIDSWLNLSMLRLLVGTADHGSLSASARAAGIAQSNASRSLRTLERRLGYTLLHRSTRGSTLTAEGVLTVEWAREVLEAVDRLAAGAEALAHRGQEELTIGSSMTIAEHLLPGWIWAFRAQRPGVATRLTVMNSAQVIQAVAGGDVALGFVETPDLPAGLQHLTVFTDQLVVVARPGHPWAQLDGPLEPAELAVTALVEREEGSGTRAFLDRLVDDHRPAPLVELNSNSAICQAVIEGIGPAVLSRLAVAGYLRSGQLTEIPTRGRQLGRTLQAVWRDRLPPAGAAAAFVEVARGAGSLPDAGH
ncbi:LysR substrate-binding domain-containing protein [Microbacterium sp. A93]|uniref:LysR substrate-binding domain-containing protein n=1 Tax=Microbacterium sp. A93 TaxID=3450716 RepID=UPI003F43A3C3